MSLTLDTAAGPLAWVHPEILLALDAVTRALRLPDWAAPGLRVGVMAHLHQVSGALHMVNLPAEQRLAESIERAVGAHQPGPPPAGQSAVLADTMAVLRHHLDARLVGRPVRDEDLLPALQALDASCGRVTEPDALFFPDLQAFPPGRPLAETTLAAEIRAEFQRGLLQCLRTPEAGGLALLAAAVQRAADQAPGRFGAMRWALLAGWLRELPVATLTARRTLLGRIDRQLRQSGCPDDDANDDLLRAVLFQIARLESPGAALRQALLQARVAELQAPLPQPPASDPAVMGADPRRALLLTLQGASTQLESWCQLNGAGALPDSLMSEFSEAVSLCDAGGDDAALLLLEDAATRLQAFPPANQLSDAQLEPVVEILAALLRYAEQALEGGVADVAPLLHLRARLQPAELTVEPLPAVPATVDLVAHDINHAVLGVFLDEADLRLAALRTDLQTLLTATPSPYQAADGAADAAGALTQVRAHLQTLRGSGLMAGLLPLAQLCRELDQVMGAYHPVGGAGWQLPCTLVREGVTEMQRWLARLANDQRSPLDAVALIERARVLRAQPTLRLAPLISLQDIFLEEAADRLEDLQALLGSPGTSLHSLEEAGRVLHTLTGIARTAGHPGIAALADALQHRLLQLQQVVPVPPQPRVQEALAALQAMHARLRAGQPIQPADALVRALQHDGNRIEAAPAAGPIKALPISLPDHGSGSVPAAGAVDDLEGIEDQPDAELLPIFREEASELLPVLQQALQLLRDGDDAAVDALRRGLHTLKGSARMAGCLRIGEQAHRLEDQVQALAARSPAADVPQSVHETLQQGLDRLAAAIGLPAVSAAIAVPSTTSAAADAAFSLAIQEGAVCLLPAPAEPYGDSAQTMIRLRVDLLDRMANAAGEAGIGRARADTEVQGLKRGLGDLVENIQRLKMQLRDIEIHADQGPLADLPSLAARDGFDPLEMDRYSRLQELTSTLAEGIDDVQTVQLGLKRGLDDIELALRQQGRVVRDLQQDLLRARMVPFASLLDRLQRTVRLAGGDVRRSVVLQVEGAQHEVDRAILERLAAPLEHLLRNAVVHAIEEAAQREVLGKPAAGQLRVTLTPGDHEIQIQVADDGRGIDLARVEAHAHAIGVPVHYASDAPGANARELLQLIFRPGFSTADRVTRAAGRGVGLDVVRNEVLGLGGRIHVDTRPGEGSEFTLVIPVTLATVQAVVVRAGDAWFAIPAPLVEQIRAVTREQFADLYEDRAASWQGLRYPLASLSRVLGQPSGAGETPGGRQLLFLRSADRRCALYVDELTGTQEIVVKAVSPHLSRLPGITGASVLGNGRIVLILNPVPLAVDQHGAIAEDLQPRTPLQALPTVMVVDDSLTVRRVSARLLERAGYLVTQAKDGVEALAMMTTSMPDALLLDVEMPRMDGFELIRRVRADARLQHLPIVVITSRTAERHRNHAAELQVQGYLGKPFREEELLQLLQNLLAPAAAQVAHSL